MIRHQLIILSIQFRRAVTRFAMRASAARFNAVSMLMRQARQALDFLGLPLFARELAEAQVARLERRIEASRDWLRAEREAIARLDAYASVGNAEDET